jgi:hypothetical protein
MKSFIFAAAAVLVCSVAVAGEEQSVLVSTPAPVAAPAVVAVPVETVVVVADCKNGRCCTNGRCWLAPRYERTVSVERTCTNCEESVKRTVTRTRRR